MDSDTIMPFILVFLAASSFLLIGSRWKFHHLPMYGVASVFMFFTVDILIPLFDTEHVNPMSIPLAYAIGHSIWSYTVYLRYCEHNPDESTTPLEHAVRSIIPFYNLYYMYVVTVHWNRSYTTNVDTEINHKDWDFFYHIFYLSFVLAQLSAFIPIIVQHTIPLLGSLGIPDRTSPHALAVIYAVFLLSILIDALILDRRMDKTALVEESDKPEKMMQGQRNHQIFYIVMFVAGFILLIPEVLNQQKLESIYGDETKYAIASLAFIGWFSGAWLWAIGEIRFSGISRAIDDSGGEPAKKMPPAYLLFIPIVQIYGIWLMTVDWYQRLAEISGDGEGTEISDQDNRWLAAPGVVITFFFALATGGALALVGLYQWEYTKLYGGLIAILFTGLMVDGFRAGLVMQEHPDLWPEIIEPVVETRDSPAPVLGSTRLRFPEGIVNQIHVGSGGMADVYLGMQPAHDRQVIVKMAHDRQLTMQLAVAQVRAEGEFLKRLNHPRVPEFYGEAELVAANGLPTYALLMEYIEGGDLKNTVQQFSKVGQRLPLDWVLDTTLAIIEPMEEVLFLPEPLYHRDLKPQNVIVHPQRGPIIIDWGLAKAVPTGSDLSITRGGSGTWTAPERDTGVSGAFTDVYSLGKMLFYMCTGETPPAILSQVDSARITDLGNPQWLAELILKATHPVHNQRVENVEHMRILLQNEGVWPQLQQAAQANSDEFTTWG